MDKLANVLKLVRSMLRNRMVASEIDEVSSPTKTALAATTEKVDPAAGTAASKKAKELEKKLKAANDKLALLSKVDPDKDKKTGKKRDKVPNEKTESGVVIPRDAEGRVTHWIEGMALCKCTGKHLFRDCELPDGSWASKAAAAYPDALITYLIMAFTTARTGSALPITQAPTSQRGGPSDQDTTPDQPASAAWEPPATVPPPAATGLSPPPATPPRSISADLGSPSPPPPYQSPGSPAGVRRSNRRSPTSNRPRRAQPRRWQRAQLAHEERWMRSSAKQSSHRQPLNASLYWAMPPSARSSVTS